jgi:branched-chain amino acid transport system substrate-binding protein
LVVQRVNVWHIGGVKALGHAGGHPTSWRSQVRLRYSKQLGAVAVVAALALTGCGSSSSGNTASGNGGKKCGNYAIGFFGALTGPAANLGKSEEKGAKLAVDQYNQKNPSCKVTLKDFDSQGDPAQATNLAKQVIDDKSVLGVVGPAFSGESDAADPLFEQGQVPTITASATETTLNSHGWKFWHRILGNDDSQGPAAATYIADILKAKKVFVIDDASAYGKGLATTVKAKLGSKVVGTDTIQQKQTDFSATVTKVKSSGADAVFFGGYYAEAGLIRKQLSGAGVTATMVVGDGVKDPGFIAAAGKKAAEGTIITCPCLPPNKSGSFAADYQAANGSPPGTYGAEAFDAANVFLAGIKSGITDRVKLNDFVTAYNGQGATKQVAFSSNGEVTNVVVWAYKVHNGQIVPDQEVK